MKEGDRLRRALKIRNRILNVMRSEVVILVGACNWEGDWFCIDFSCHTLANYWKEGYKSHSWKTRKPGREFGWSFQYFFCSLTWLMYNFRQEADKGFHKLQTYEKWHCKNCYWVTLIVIGIAWSFLSLCKSYPFWGSCDIYFLQMFIFCIMATKIFYSHCVDHRDLGAN